MYSINNIEGKFVLITSWSHKLKGIILIVVAASKVKIMSWKRVAIKNFLYEGRYF